MANWNQQLFESEFKRVVCRRYARQDIFWDKEYSSNVNRKSKQTLSANSKTFFK